MGARWLLLCTTTTIAVVAGRADAWQVEVGAGEHDRENVPVSVELPADIRITGTPYLVEMQTGARIPAQIESGTPRRLWWILRRPLAAGAKRVYGLESRDASPDGAAGAGRPTPRVTLVENSATISAAIGERPVLQYNKQPPPVPAGVKASVARSGYLHPVWNPREQVVTDDYASDHAHQHGIMLAWRKATFRGRAMNFWETQEGAGSIRHMETVRTVNGPVFGELVVRLSHFDPRTAEGRGDVLDETWQVRIYNVQDTFLFDLVSSQQCATNDPLTLEEYHYGCLAVRGARAWQSGPHGFLTSEGLSREDGDSSRARWCGISGPLDGESTGVTVFCHPDNFRAPQPVRLHPRMPYFCFTPAALGPFRISPGKPYVSRYRFAVHIGDPEPQQMNARYADFVAPPVAKLVDGGGTEQRPADSGR